MAQAMPTKAASGRRPNIIVVLADDLGYECIGANGCTSYKTPNLDRLAAEGMRFDACYVQPLCTPTRVQMMTGLYNIRNYIEFGKLDPRCTTFANLFQKSGYATCMAGKWQLGPDPLFPKKCGFDEYCLWQHMRWAEHKEAPPAERSVSRYYNPGLEINGVVKDYTHGEYGPDVVSDYALDFIARKKDQPFLLYYTMMLTHAPYSATPESTDYGQKIHGSDAITNHRPDGINQHFHDMVEHTDKLMGKLVDKLDALGIRNNTLLIFLGDNGTAVGTMSMMGDKKCWGGKGRPRDDGMHVPLIVSWPGHGTVGKTLPDLVDSTDFFPTICEVAGIPIPKELELDGRSFAPRLNGEKGNPRDSYYCWYGAKLKQGILGEFAATRDYKLTRIGEFFDLRKDLEELAPIPLAKLTGETKAIAARLQLVLDRYKDARPKDLPAYRYSISSSQARKKKMEAEANKEDETKW